MGVQVSGESADADKSLALLGVGVMGRVLAERLLVAGYSLKVWNRTAARAEPLREFGATPVRTPWEAVSGTPNVITMLADADAITAVLNAGAAEAMSPGTVWLQMGTVGVQTTERLASWADSENILFVDAPVIGTRGPAERGEMVILASGPEKARETVGPILSALGRKTLWLGPAGAGARMKLVVNNWIISLISALAESMALAEGLGVRPEDFVEAIEGGPVGMPSIRERAVAMLERSDDVSWAIRWALKDAQLIHAAAEGCGLNLPVAEASLEQLNEAVGKSLGDADTTRLFSLLSPSGDT